MSLILHVILMPAQTCPSIQVVTKPQRYPDDENEYGSEPRHDGIFHFLGLMVLINAALTACLGILAAQSALVANAFIRKQGGPHVKIIRSGNAISHGNG